MSTTLSHASKRRSQLNHNDVGLEITSKVLRTLEMIALASPIPGLSESAGMALQLTETVQRIRTNRDAYQRLAVNTCELVCVVCHAYQGVSDAKDADPELDKDLDNILKVLLSIQDLANKGALRGKFKAFWRASVDADKIKECMERLQQCLSKFGFESDINIRFIVHKLVSQNETIMRILENSNGPIQANEGENDVLTNQKQRQLSDAAEVGKGFWKCQPISVGDNMNFSGAIGVTIGSNNMIVTRTIVS